MKVFVSIFFFIQLLSQCIVFIFSLEYVNSEDKSVQITRSYAEVYLRRYGYLETFQSYATRTEFKKAIRLFQRHNELKVTGKLNKGVIYLMKQPRCGYPDVISRRRYRRYAQRKKGWKYNVVRWSISGFSAKLRPFLQWKTFKRALGFWSRHSPLRFKYRRKNPEINIMFARGEHGDGYYNAFDGRGHTLAHAFEPPSGETHFDEDEPWTLSDDVSLGVNLLPISVHEIGHAIGLVHVPVREAIMSSYTKDYQKLELHPEERKQLEQLYGTKRHPKVRPRIAKRRKSRRRVNPRVVNVSHLGDPCEHIDDLFLDKYGYNNVFSGKIVFNVNEYGQRRQTPNNVRARYAGAPHDIDAATYVPGKNRVYFFKSIYVWRVTDNRVDVGFPQIVPFHKTHEVPRAAVTLTTGPRSRLYLFGEKTFWEWNIKRDKVSRRFALETGKYWRGIPTAPDAAVSGKDQYIYFIKDKKYYKVNPISRKLEQGYPRQMPPPWLVPMCHSQQNN